VLPPQLADSSLQKDQADEPRFPLNRYGFVHLFKQFARNHAQFSGIGIRRFGLVCAGNRIIFR